MNEPEFHPLSTEVLLSWAQNYGTTTSTDSTDNDSEWEVPAYEGVDADDEDFFAGDEEFYGTDEEFYTDDEDFYSD